MARSLKHANANGTFFFSWIGWPLGLMADGLPVLAFALTVVVFTAGCGTFDRGEIGADRKSARRPSRMLATTTNEIREKGKIEAV